MPGPPPEDDEAMAAAGKVLRPLGQAAGEGAGVFVEAGHLDGRLGALALELGGAGVGLGVAGAGGLLGCGCGLDGAGVIKQFKLLAGDVDVAEAGGAEEDDGVLDALAAETGHGLVVLGGNAEGAAFGGVEEVGVFVGERGLVEGSWDFAVRHARSWVVKRFAA